MAVAIARAGRPGPVSHAEDFPFSTLPELFWYAVWTHDLPNAMCTLSADGCLPVSHRELGETVRSFALGLHSLGLRRGDTVGLLAPSSPMWVCLDIAIQSAGCVTVPLFKRISAESFSHEVRDSGMRYLFIGNRDELPMVREQAGPGVTLVEFWQPGGSDAFREIRARGEERDRAEPELYEELASQVHEPDLATIIYTSGSTGLPKGVELSQRNLVSQVKACSEIFPMEPGRDTALSLLPPEHIFERMVISFYVARGIPIHFGDDPKRLGELLRAVRPSIMTVVPRILEKAAQKMADTATGARGIRGLVARAAVRRARRDPGRAGARGAGGLLDGVYRRLVYRRFTEALGGRLRYVISGSSRLDPGIARFLVAVGVPVYEGYGLTEASPVVAANCPAARRVGTVGKPIPGVEVKIASDGEILARGPNVMGGYRNDPAATAEVLLPGGWLATGDLGEIDGDGYLTIRNRKKEMFKKSTGEYVPPAPIERELQRIPWVDTAVVIADARPYVVALLYPNLEEIGRMAAREGRDGADARAYLESRWLSEMTRARVEEINAHRHHCERVERFVFMDHPAGMETGELTPTLKLRRAAIEESSRGLVDSLYASIGGWK
jgi:long-chain acyl-CoA synthetase